MIHFAPRSQSQSMPTYWREYFCFAYGKIHFGNFGYVMDDFGNAVIPPDMYGLAEAFWTEH